jgi:hypothetical protein
MHHKTRLLNNHPASNISTNPAYRQIFIKLLAGSNLDPIQARLPASVVALVYMLLGTFDLLTARLVSCLVGGLTIIAVYSYAAKRTNPTTGLALLTFLGERRGCLLAPL